METKYDYDNQAWIVDGKYQDCAHPNQDCGCYGREHKGETVASPTDTTEGGYRWILACKT